MQNKGKYYITTAIAYTSGKPHIGNTYEIILADCIARYKRADGYDVRFMTGSDEHGQKIESRAARAGKTPKEFVDETAGEIKRLWDLVGTSYDRFIRTTDDYHVAAVQKIFKKMYDKGDIYKGKYTGMYCTPCESFWTESQLKDGKCPDCGRDCQPAEEEAYFFKLSKYAQPVRDLLTNTDFLEPKSRVHEMVNNFIDAGLEDLCVSRTSFTWGVPVDFDPGHVVYVWVDALFNYTTALGFMNDKYDDYKDWWPADVHFVGKEIVRFHSIIWPAMLMSMEMPLPKKVYGHGWLLLDGGKMSKSKGNVVDPQVLADRYGVDALRFFLLRSFPFGSDGNFSNELLISCINTDLANDLGNLVSRTVAMVQKYFGGTLPLAQLEDAEKDAELTTMASELHARYETQMESYAFQNALGEIFSVISRANKYIDENAPWVLAKDENNRPRLARVMYNLLETVRICAGLLQPFMPATSEEIMRRIGAERTDWDSLCVYGGLKADTTVVAGNALFPRIDAAKELEELEKLNAKPAEPEADPLPEPLPPICFDDFCKVEMTVVKVLTCENVKKSEKLLKFTLDDGSGTPRQILSGIAKYYKPEELIGKTLVAVTNLPPRKMMGQESCGMILSAERGEKLQVVMLDDSVPAGARLV